MTLHPTYEDKNRTTHLDRDGRWHGLNFLVADALVWELKPPPGTYLVQVQLRGTWTKGAHPVDRSIDFRLDRYPFDPDDNGTAWDAIRIRSDGTWWGTRFGKIEIRPAGDYSRAVGVGYRVTRGGTVNCTDRVVKCLRQVDPTVTNGQVLLLQRRDG